MDKDSKLMDSWIRLAAGRAAQRPPAGADGTPAGADGTPAGVRGYAGAGTAGPFRVLTAAEEFNLMIRETIGRRL